MGQYEKYIIRGNKVDFRRLSKVNIMLYKKEEQNFTMSWLLITKPLEIESKTFFHDFDQYLFFIGGDLTNMMDLGGEVELSLGENEKEMEKYVFNTAAMVYIPKGLLHCPLNFKKVNNPRKPILFQELSFTNEYRKYFPGNPVAYGPTPLD